MASFLTNLFGGVTPSLRDLPYYQNALQAESSLFSLAKKQHAAAARSPVSLNVYDVPLNDSDENFIHTIEAETSSTAAMTTKSDPPLVIMHGYGNGIGYLFRNLMPIAEALKTRKVFGIDMLGFGLSSRPDFFKTIKAAGEDPSTVSGAENFFVESLEKWRSEQKIDKMVLCGHSMGGYLSCAYAAKYPERVSSLILLSPVGVPKPDEEARAERLKKAPMRFKMLIGLAGSFWNAGATPMSVLRMLPEGRGKALVDGYVFNRLRSLGEEEKVNLSSYFYSIGCLPGSGEWCLHPILSVGAMAKQPLVDRIPDLKTDVHFIYGKHDWMDVSGGLEVQSIIRSRRLNKNCEVKVVQDAGHLLNLENPAGTNSVITSLVREL